MKPVKLSVKKDPHGTGRRYYSVTIPREIGDRYADEPWFMPQAAGDGIMLLHVGVGAVLVEGANSTDA